MPRLKGLAGEVAGHNLTVSKLHETGTAIAVRHGV